MYGTRMVPTDGICMEHVWNMYIDNLVLSLLNLMYLKLEESTSGEL